ncbi:MAG: DUF6763 family protein [Steroidobacteraceae bacterium]|jgi:hypothetical protein
MNTGVGRARIGQWYLHSDKGEIFQVTGFDVQARTIEIQSFDGDVDEIDEDSWTTIPLEFAEPPEDWNGPVDAVVVDDLGYSETEMTAKDWQAPLQPLSVMQEAWDDPSDEDDFDPEGEGLPIEDLALDNPAASELVD